MIKPNILLFGLAPLFSGQAMASFVDIVGDVSAIEIHSTDPVEQASCEVGLGFTMINNVWYWFPGSGEEGATILSLLATAKVSGLKVSIRVTDQRNKCPSEYKKIVFIKINP